MNYFVLALFNYLQILLGVPNSSFIIELSFDQEPREPIKYGMANPKSQP